MLLSPYPTTTERIRVGGREVDGDQLADLDRRLEATGVRLTYFEIATALGFLALAEAAVEIAAKVDEQVEASSEVAQVVAALERQYDAFIAAQENRSLLARDEDLPSGDELGAEFERFLAQEAEKKFDDDDPT